MNSFSEKFLSVEEDEVPPIMTAKNDEIIWNIFPEFGVKKVDDCEQMEEVEEEEE